jgi:hypothetical protein
MDQRWRWAVASSISFVATGASWVAAQFVFGLDVPTAVTIATSAAAVIGTPAAAWAAVRSSSPQPRASQADNGTIGGRIEPTSQSVLPVAWNIPARSLAFTGRHELLVRVRNRLEEGSPVAIIALHGMGGIGKTSLATEYAHRFAEEYAIAWWINAENRELIEDQMARLGVAAGWVPDRLETPDAVREVLRNLRGNTGWLVIFDNVDTPEHLLPMLPQGPGHVILTSRNSNLRQLAEPVEVDVFSRKESIALIRRLAPAVNGSDADRIAQETGDLPLAVAQGAGVIAETAMTALEYLGEFAKHAASVMEEGKPAGYPTSLAATVALSLDRLRVEDPAAAELVRVCALLAPEEVPIWIFSTTAGASLPPPLGAATGSALSMRRIVAHARRYGLVKAGEAGPQLHRLTKAIIADQLNENDRDLIHSAIEKLLVAAAPGDSRDPSAWPRWALLLPHLNAVDPANSENPALREMACEASWYLLDRGDVAAGYEMSSRIYEGWRVRLGGDDPDTLLATHSLSVAYQRLGKVETAYELSSDTLVRRTRKYGRDHRTTLQSAVAVAWQLWQLGRLQQAYDLSEDTLRRLRRTRGEDSRLTLGAAHNMSIMIGEFGRLDEAIALDEDTYQRRQSLLGDDHPHTLISMLTLSGLLHRSGREGEATQLCGEALSRCREVLGEDHYTTLDAMARMALILTSVGKSKEALAMREEVFTRRGAISGADHPFTLRAARDVAESLRATGRIRKAKAIEAKLRP